MKPLKNRLMFLEEQAIKALTGENQLDLSIVNSMLIKHKAKMEDALEAMGNVENQMNAIERNARATKLDIEEIRSWVDRYDEISVEAKHMVISRLIDRVEISKKGEVHFRLKVAMEQLIEKTA